MLNELKPILEKDPIISTYSALDVINTPGDVEQYYSLIAKTHMSLGDTKEYQNRIYNCIVKNKSTFNGAVVGEYGFGKTSILIYFWKYCDDNNILSIPPYQWSSFQEHFQVIYSWATYKIRKYNNKIQDKLDAIYNKYKDTSIESKAISWSKVHGVDLEKAISILNDEFNRGKVSLDVTPDDLLRFCNEITIFLQSETTYKGLLVITDELQQTITELNPKLVYDYLFNISNPLCNANGNYGFLWGFPEKTFADLGRERSDIIDRLHSNKAFIRLGNIYDKNFPIYLWQSYSKLYGFEDIKYKIVDESTLISMGQICDGERRDLGNGPRSVISALNSMVNHYNTKKTSYDVINFIEDCLDGEITLGGSSEFRKIIQSILNIDIIGEKFEKVIKILSGFPTGIPQSVVNKYDLNEELELLIKQTGGLGKVVIRNINSYMLKVLAKTQSDYEDSVIEDEVRKFYGQFAPDQTYKNISLKTFNKIIIEKVFSKSIKGSFEGWKEKEPWVRYREGYRCILTGSFDKKYPLRNIVLFACIGEEGKIPEQVLSDIPKEHLALNLLLFYKNDHDAINKIEKLGINSFQINIDLSYQEDSLKLNRINEIIPKEKQTPLFFLSLIDHLTNANIPKNEIPDLEFLTAALRENIIYNLFNEDMLGEVENSEIELNNEGELIIKDLFVSACDESFGNYRTLMKSTSWNKKLTTYDNVLNLDSEKLTLLQKRGKESLQLSDNPKENKSLIAKLFSQKSANFESWLKDLDEMVEYKFDKNNSKFLFKTHPLEKYFLEQIEEYGKERIIDGNQCKTLRLDARFMQNTLGFGYLPEEILLVLKIGESRKYFNFDKQKQIIFKKPEDKHELQESLSEFYNKVNDQILKLSCYDEYPVSLDEVEKLYEKIQIIENNEQADKLKNDLRELQSKSKYFCKNSIGHIVDIEINSINRDLVSSKDLLNSLLKDNIDDEVLGKVYWVSTLEKIRINIGHEIHQLLKTTNIISDRLKKCTPPNIPDNVYVIDLFIELSKEFESIKREIEKSYLIELDRAKEKVIQFKKWKTILRLSGDLDGLHAKYEKFGILSEFKANIDSINNNISNNLTDNQRTTLNNHENYNQEIKEILGKVKGKIVNLRQEWEQKKKNYEKLISKFTGQAVILHARWSESPEISYQDLYDSVTKQIELYLKKNMKRVNELSDDITYSMEVLNHKTAIENREINIRCIDIRDKLICYLNDDIGKQIDRQEKIENMVEDFKEVNKIYGEIFKQHRSIIKPARIEDFDEKKFFELLEKNESQDLKRLIIDYQKRCDPDIDLTQCRDKVLSILKELFLKKQIGILVKKGKS